MDLSPLTSRLTDAERQAVALVIQELLRAKEKHPRWPTDPVHASAILAEEAGEAVKAALDVTYADGDYRDWHEELSHTGAMALRCLSNEHEPRPSGDEG